MALFNREVAIAFVLALLFSSPRVEGAPAKKEKEPAKTKAAVSTNLKSLKKKQIKKKAAPSRAKPSQARVPMVPTMPAPPPVYVEPPAIPKPDSAPVEVDLAQAPASKPEHRPVVGFSPQLHMIFDLLLSWRPSVAPLSFDNYHSFILAEVLPTPESSVSAEVNPNPRFFEFGYRIHPNWLLRAGKIWVPFNGMMDTEPHSMAGGWYGTTRLFSTYPYLPDIWADLGLAFKTTLKDEPSLQSYLQGYVINGYGSGGTDPLGQVSATAYPSFTTPTLAGDNNNDKGLGGRLTTLFSGRYGLGASFYTGRFTPDTVGDGRITLLGIDGQLRLGAIEVRSGWMNMWVSLPSPASPSTFSRPGLYLEGVVRLLGHWKWVARYGSLNTDSRVENAGDRSIVGGVIAYDLGFYQVSLEAFADLQRTADKPPTAFSALRFFLRL